MIQNHDRTDRRILKFPAVHPCEGISPATLLQSLITLSKTICSYQSKFFATQRRIARETVRQISILAILFEEIGDRIPDISDSVILCLSELHITLQMIHFLLDDCSREGSRTLILMKYHFIANKFQSLIRVVATTLDVLPLNSIAISCEIKEFVEMLSKQSRNAKMEIDPEDENAMKRVILVMNQFENKFEPDRFMIKRILGHLRITTWLDCHREVKFLEEEIRAHYSERDEREVPLLSNLLGLLSYCRGVVFNDSQFVVDHSEGRTSNFEVISCLNPEDFRCPISLELMTDPVTVSTGQTYDRVSIKKWLKSGNFVCPKTGEKLTSLELIPNSSLKKLIHQYCAEYGISLSKSSKNSHDLSHTILPGSPACAGAIKFLSEFLALNLGFGTNDQKYKGAYEVRLLAKSNLFNRSCLIESGCVPPLLELITSTDPSMQENAISALLKLSKLPRGQKAIIDNGGLNPVLKVLKNGAKFEAKQTAAATIFYLSSAHVYRKLISENEDTIPYLLELIKEGGKKNAVMAIFALLFHHKNREKAISAGAVTILLNLLQSCDKVELKTDTLGVISTLADSRDGSMRIVHASGLPLILHLLKSIESSAGKEYCVSILHSMCLNCGSDVLSFLAKDATIMSTLYSLLTEGTSQAGKKARSLIKMLQKFYDTRSSCPAREVRHGQFVNVR